MPYVCSAPQLAHYVVQKCSAEGKPVSNLQLQKILYFLQTVYCEATGDLLFPEEFEAWPYGPVMKEVYSEYSWWGGYPIDKGAGNDVPRESFGDAANFIDQGVEFLRAKYPWDLVKVSHAEGSPWDLVWNDRRRRDRVIPNSMLRDCCRA